MPTVYLGLGSNLNDRQVNIQKALDLLCQKGVRVERVSTVIETDPVGGPAQGKFLNAVAKATTDLEPLALLKTTQAVEYALGRKRTVPNGPRTIDIDILLYEDRTIDLPQLTVPHPRMRERAFVLDPLAQIAPEIVQKIIQNKPCASSRP